MKWYDPQLQHARQRATLERDATRLLAADRRRRNKPPAVLKTKAPAPTSTLPRRLTLSDLVQLRKRGLVP
jgi:hypothetical protein